MEPLLHLLSFLLVGRSVSEYLNEINNFVYTPSEFELTDSDVLKNDAEMEAYFEDLNELLNKAGIEPSHTSDGQVPKRVTSGRSPEERGGFFEGDIVVPGIDARNGIKLQSRRWENGVIPFEISKGFGNKALNNIKQAISNFTGKTCIKLVKRSGQQDFIRFTSHNTGCWSAVGKIGGMQEVNIPTPGCTSKVGRIAHEIMHALGFVHENSRADRDNFVTIYEENVKNGSLLNFDKAPTGMTTAFDVPYDYSSVMHYGMYTFSANGRPTIVPKKAGAVIGLRARLSDGDLMKIRRMYNCA